MKFFVSLLFLSTADLVSCSKWADVTFPPELLKPDLKALEYYFEHIANSVSAYVEWPNGITFQVQYHKITDKGYYLNITGSFKVPQKGCISLLWATYNGLYFKHKKFYFLTRKEPFLKPISEETPLFYTQPELRKPQNYLSIKYFGLEEIKDIIEPFYAKHRYYLEQVLDKTALFLAVAPRSKDFIEYSFWKTLPKDGFISFPKQVLKERKMRVLIGAEGTPKKRILSRSEGADDLVFHKTHQNFTVSWMNYERRRHFDDAAPEAFENVFGIRMTRTGVLAEVRESKVKMFNSDDLAFGSSYPPKHVVSIISFLEKVVQVEPRYIRGDNVAYRHQPKSNYFQVSAHVLEKKYNFLNGKSIAEDCPIVIEYVENGSYFWYGENLKVEQLCTDDKKLWVKTTDGKIVDSQDEIITLTFPQE